MVERGRSVFIRIAALIVIAVGMFAYTKFVSAGGDYIIVFAEEKISVEEYKLFFQFSQPGDPDAALDDLINYLVIGRAAKANGVTLTDEEKANVASDIEDMRTHAESVGIEMPNISAVRFEEMLSVPYLYPKLAEAATDSFVVDEAKFEVTAAEDWEKYKDSFGGGSEMSDEFLVSYREYYIQVNKYYMFEMLFKSWKAEANITVNQKVFDTFVKS